MYDLYSLLFLSLLAEFKSNSGYIYISRCLPWAKLPLTTHRMCICEHSAFCQRYIYYIAYRMC